MIWEKIWEIIEPQLGLYQRVPCNLQVKSDCDTVIVFSVESFIGHSLDNHIMPLC
jgi:hypothetical protein